MTNTTGWYGQEQRHGRHRQPVWPVDDPEIPTPRTASDPGPVVRTPPETAATGLRTFDLGNVPASVTPPRSWRRAAWFAVGTSAAVVLGLTVAAAELMGRPVRDTTLIEALPAYPTRPLILAEPPDVRVPTDSSSPAIPTTSSSTAAPPVVNPAVVIPPVPDEPARDAVAVGDNADRQTSGDASGQYPMATTPNVPSRRTVGPVPLTPTDPRTMGDRTEQYFALVTYDPAAAHAMTSGGLARDGAGGIGARYTGVRRVEVQDIVIDRNHAVTTSTVKIIRQDGTETVERRQLTFTWGGNPRITGEMITQ